MTRQRCAMAAEDGRLLAYAEAAERLHLSVQTVRHLDEARHLDEVEADLRVAAASRIAVSVTPK